MTFRSIAQRWVDCCEQGGMNAIPKPEKARGMLLFYAGFSAALEANMELANLSEEQAMQVLTMMHAEMRQFEAMATQAVLGGTVQ